jgi:hypothetical protein
MPSGNSLGFRAGACRDMRQMRMHSGPRRQRLTSLGEEQEEALSTAKLRSPLVAS